MSEDILWRWKQKAIKEKGSGEWGHLLRKKRLLQTKDCGEWGHTFGIKNILGKWWVRTFFEDKNKRQSKKKDLVSEDIYWEKKSLLQTKDRGEWGHTFGKKESSGNGDWGHSLKIKTKCNQRKRDWWVRTSIEKKKIITNKRSWWVRTHFWGKKILRK